MAEFEFVEKYSLYEQPLQYWSYLLNVNLRPHCLHSVRRVSAEILCQKCYWIQSYLGLSCWLQQFSNKHRLILQHYWVISRKDGFWPVGFCFAVPVLEEKISEFCLGSKFFAQGLSYWQSYKIAFFYHLSESSLSSEVIDPPYFYQWKNKPHVWIFNFLLFRAQIKSRHRRGLALGEPW